MTDKLFMKAILLTAMALIADAGVCAQGTFSYDQQSSTDEGLPYYGSGASLGGLFPSTGQSFTPSFSGVNFVRLKFNDGNLTDGLGATIYLDIRSGSITGTILGTTAPVTMVNGFRGTQNFYFPDTIPLTPRTTYYFELVMPSGGPWNVDAGSYNYTGGEAYAQGQPYPGSDYWFREGLYTVPEPSGFMVTLLGVGAVAVRRHHR